VEPRDIADDPFLALALEDGMRHMAEEIFGNAGITPRLRIETPYSATLCRLVAEGLGVALVNPLVAADDARKGSPSPSCRSGRSSPSAT
jgi:DNA-binding transcriptional LysR family regulator